MAPEAAYSVSSSVVETKPRLREEVREEQREEIRLLEMNRVSAQEKLRAEREAVERSAGDVEMFERAWRKTQPETIADIERKVDVLDMSAPRFPRPEGRQAPRRAPTLEVTPAPAPPARAARALGQRLSPAEQRAIGAHLGGQLTKYDVLFTTSRGRVVECRYEKGGEAAEATVLLHEENKVWTLDEIGAKLDAMRLPSRPPAAEGPRDTAGPSPGPGPSVREQPAEEAAAPAEDAWLRGTRELSRKVQPAAAPAPAEPAPPEEAEEAEAPGPEAPPGKSPKKKFGLQLGKKPGAAAPARAEPEQGEGKKKFGLKFGRKK